MESGGNKEGDVGKILKEEGSLVNWVQVWPTQMQILKPFDSFLTLWAVAETFLPSSSHLAVDGFNISSPSDNSRIHVEVP